jgi:hypothetical protein
MVTLLLPILRRFWWAVPLLGLFIALLITRGTLADVKGERDEARTKTAETQAAFDQTVSSYRATRDQARQSDELNKLRVGKQQAEISKEVLDGYQERLASLRADFAERVRRATGANPGGGGAADLSGLSTAPGGLAATACQAEFPAKDALIASEQAEQLVALQAWVKRQHAIDPNGSTE